MTVADVIRILTKAGYTLLPSPLKVAGVEFSFSATLGGPAGTLSLVVVIDTGETPAHRLLRQVEALAQALDLAGSRQSLTVTLTGDAQSDVDLDALGQVCRVLLMPATNVASQSTVNETDPLAVLLPLKVGGSGHTQKENPLDRVTKNLPDHLVRDLADSGLAQAASLGAETVKSAFSDWILEALDPKANEQ